MAKFQIIKDVFALRESMRGRSDYGCFWSSPDNERGLRLTPTIEPGRVFLDLKIEVFHSGFPGIANGGVSFTILDGMMGWYLMSHTGRGGFTKTASLNYLAPLHVGKTYRFEVTAEESESSADSFKLKGQVFPIKNSVKSIGSRPLLVMTADFALPNRKTAELILQVPLGPEGEDLFPVT
jgi:acyl-coenzyme A thioesterase PaaI-like protein